MHSEPPNPSPLTDSRVGSLPYYPYNIKSSYPGGNLPPPSSLSSIKPPPPDGLETEPPSGGRKSNEKPPAPPAAGGNEVVKPVQYSGNLSPSSTKTGGLMSYPSSRTGGPSTYYPSSRTGGLPYPSSKEVRSLEEAELILNNTLMEKI